MQRFIINKYLKTDNGKRATFKERHNYDFRLDNLIFLSRATIKNRINENPPESGYRGVHKWYKRYVSKISNRVNGMQKYYCLGTFNTPWKAAEAYNIKARELFGKFAYQNEIKKVKSKRA